MVSQVHPVKMGYQGHKVGPEKWYILPFIRETDI